MTTKCHNFHWDVAAEGSCNTAALVADKISFGLAAKTPRKQVPSSRNETRNWFRSELPRVPNYPALPYMGKSRPKA